MSDAVDCPRCGRTSLTWGDVRFGHPRPGEPEGERTCSVTRLPAVSTASFDKRSGYQPSLARFPGDPTAFAETPAGLRKLEDRRLREGWVDKADLAADKRHLAPGERSALAKKWAPAMRAALKGDTTEPLDRVGVRPETTDEGG